MLVQLLALAQQTFTCLLHLYSGCYANIFIFILFGDLMPQLTGYLLVDIVQNSAGSCSSCCFRHGFIKKQPLTHVLRAVHILMENLFPLVGALDCLRCLALLFRHCRACAFFR